MFASTLYPTSAPLRCQGDRMNDQRATLPAFPGLRLFDRGRHSCTAGGTLTSMASGASDGLPEGDQLDSLRTGAAVSMRPRTISCAVGDVASSAEILDDEFLEMIFRLQTRTRINDQRSSLPDPLLSTSIEAVGRQNRQTSVTVSTGPSLAPTVPDEDFFALIQRIQSARLDEQRCNPPPSTTPDAVEEPHIHGSTSSSMPTIAASDRKSSTTSRRRRGSSKPLNSTSSGTQGR